MDTNTPNTETKESQSVLHVSSGGVIIFKPGDRLPQNIKNKDGWDQLEQFILQLSSSLANLNISSNHDSGNVPRFLSPYIEINENGHHRLIADLKPDLTQLLAKRNYESLDPVRRAMQEMYCRLRGIRDHDIKDFVATVVHGPRNLVLSCPHKCRLIPRHTVNPDRGYRVESHNAHNNIELLTLFSGLIKIQEIVDTET